MPEEQKTISAPAETTAENGTGTNSPTKSPVSKGKMALAKVTLLDGTVKDFYIDVSCQEKKLPLIYVSVPRFPIRISNLMLQRKAKGQELLDMICQSMNLLEKDYFGLIYEDRHDPRNWLDLHKRITKFVKSTTIAIRSRSRSIKNIVLLLKLMFAFRRAVEI
jgi:erythrocyte membrane protein band 4.1